MDESRRTRKSTARERHIARQEKRDTMVRQRRLSPTLSPSVGSGRLGKLAVVLPWMQRAGWLVRDLVWYISHNTRIAVGIGLVVAVIVGFFVATHIFTGRIFPNIWALGVPIGDLTVEDAETILLNTWQSQVRIDLMVEGKRVISLSPADLGLALDVKKTAEAARSVGLAGMPFGYNVTPIISVDELSAQNALLDVLPKVEIVPFNAGYTWENGQLVGVSGRDGRTLDVTLTLQRLTQDPAGVVMSRQLDLLLSPVPPDVVDPAPFLADARDFARQPLTLVGYDPFTDQTFTWTTSPQDFTNWLQTGTNSLALREEAFMPYIRSIEATMNAPSSDLRYLDPKETLENVHQAISNKQSSVALRIHYRPTSYQIVQGDTGQAIARKTGIPFFLIEEANPGLNWNLLIVGTSINLPSRDKTVPKPPVSNKRIVVNLNTFKLAAYENAQLVFNWKISTGRNDAPTSPGIFQILNHQEEALGSGFSLCTDLACGQWKMYWFMGMYEVRPGLMNGFHGAVLLPNGAYLSGGNVGGRDTFGCVMSENAEAKSLYDWATEGTVVEIVSDEFAPVSDVGRLALQQALSS